MESGRCRKCGGSTNIICRGIQMFIFESHGMGGIGMLGVGSAMVAKWMEGHEELEEVEVK